MVSLVFRPLRRRWAFRVARIGSQIALVVSTLTSSALGRDPLEDVRQ